MLTSVPIPVPPLSNAGVLTDVVVAAALLNPQNPSPRFHLALKVLAPALRTSSSARPPLFHALHGVHNDDIRPVVLALLELKARKPCYCKHLPHALQWTSDEGFLKASESIASAMAAFDTETDGLKLRLDVNGVLRAHLGVSEDEDQAVSFPRPDVVSTVCHAMNDWHQTQSSDEERLSAACSTKPTEARLRLRRHLSEGLSPIVHALVGPDCDRFVVVSPPYSAAESPEYDPSKGQTLCFVVTDSIAGLSLTNPERRSQFLRWLHDLLRAPVSEYFKMAFFGTLAG